MGHLPREKSLPDFATLLTERAKPPFTTTPQPSSRVAVTPTFRQMQQSKPIHVSTGSDVMTINPSRLTVETELSAIKSLHDIPSPKWFELMTTPCTIVDLFLSVSLSKLQLTQIPCIARHWLYPCTKTTQGTLRCRPFDTTPLTSSPL